MDHEVEITTPIEALMVMTEAMVSAIDHAQFMMKEDRETLTEEEERQYNKAATTFLATMNSLYKANVSVTGNGVAFKMECMNAKIELPLDRDISLHLWLLFAAYQYEMESTDRGEGDEEE